MGLFYHQFSPETGFRPSTQTGVTRSLWVDPEKRDVYSRQSTRSQDRPRASGRTRTFWRTFTLCLSLRTGRPWDRHGPIKVETLYGDNSGSPRGAVSGRPFGDEMRLGGPYFLRPTGSESVSRRPLDLL